jgi:thymidylate synthase (FAD)
MNDADRALYEKTLHYVKEQYVRIKERSGYEVARYLLPLATHCAYVWTINARSLINFLQLRLCKNAAPEMQELAKHVKGVVEKVYPELFASIDCRGSQSKICPEPKNRSCGKYPHQV